MSQYRSLKSSVRAFNMVRIPAKAKWRIVRVLIRITILIRLWMNGWTLKRLDAHLLCSYENWYAGRCREILFNYDASLNDVFILFPYCHGFDENQISQDLFGFFADLVLPAYLYRRYRWVRSLVSLTLRPVRGFHFAIRFLVCNWELALVLLAVLLFSWGRTLLVFRWMN